MTNCINKGHPELISASNKSLFQNGKGFFVIIFVFEFQKMKALAQKSKLIPKQ